MHIKFMKHGSGSAGKAVKYLLGEKDHAGVVRSEVSVLRGSPEVVAKVADSLDFKLKYRSAVIAWAPDDKPTEQDIEGVLDDFEKAMAGGLDPARLSYAAVLHREESGGCHIHILAARVDLETGRSFNPAPPGWQNTYDPLRDMWNLEKSWARPDDPARARLVQPGHLALVEAAELRAGVRKSEDPKGLIASFIRQRVEAGAVTDRAGVVGSLRDAGFEINRAGSDYISVRDPGTEKKYRLKGALYAADFNAKECQQSLRETESEDRRRSEKDTASDREKAGAARDRFNEKLERISEYNNKRYSVSSESVEKTGVDVVRHVDVVADSTSHSRDFRSGHLHELAAQRSESSSGERVSSKSRASEPAAGVRSVQEPGGMVPGGPEDFLSEADRNGKRKKGRRGEDRLKRGSHDRTGEAIAGRIDRLDEACGKFGESVAGHDEELRDFVKGAGGFGRAGSEYGRTAQNLDESAGKQSEQSNSVVTAVRRVTEAVKTMIDEALAPQQRQFRGPSPFD